MIAEFIHLRVIKLDDADKLRRCEQLASACAQAAVSRDAGMRGKPAGDRGRVDGMAMTRGKAAGGVFKGMALIVGGEGFEDFGQRIRLVADGARARREAAITGPADVKADGFQFLETAAFDADVRAVAVRAALRGFDRR